MRAYPTIASVVAWPWMSRCCRRVAYVFHMPPRPGRRVERDIDLLLLLVQVEPGPESPGTIEYVHVGVVDGESEARIGAELESGVDSLRSGFDHVHSQRRGGGLRGVRIDGKIDRVEVARFEQAPLKEVELDRVIRFARPHRVEIFHDARRIALHPAYDDRTGEERGTAVELELQIGRALRRVDACFAMTDARGRIAPARKPRERTLLGGGPTPIGERARPVAAPKSGARRRSASCLPDR